MQLRLLFSITALLAAPAAWAVNKCTLADGSVVYQSAACGLEYKSEAKVKTWTNSGFERVRAPGQRKHVEPDLELKGPEQAKPLLELYRRWADADKLARTTARIALAGPMGNLQALQREVEGLRVPECLVDARSLLAKLVAESNEALLQFMGKNEVSNMAYELVHKPKLLPAFEKALASADC